METVEDVKKKAKNLFVLFEQKEGSNTADEREIPTIIRAMGLNPTQDQLRYFIEEVRGEDSTSGLVEYDRFEKVIVKALTDRKGEFLRDSETKLMRAFRAFDPENKGYIDGENLKNLLMTQGDAFRPEEATEMLSAAVDENTGYIYYEDFAELLANDGRDL